MRTSQMMINGQYVIILMRSGTRCPIWSTHTPVCEMTKTSPKLKDIHTKIRYNVKKQAYITYMLSQKTRHQMVLSVIDDVVSHEGGIHYFHLKPTQTQMSLVVSEIVLKNKFAIKRYETVLYTCNI